VWWDEIGDEALSGYLEAPPDTAPRRSLWANVRFPDNGDPEGTHRPASTLPLEPLARRRPRLLSATFVRAFEVPFDQAAAALDHWWHDKSATCAIEVGRSWLIGPPVHESGGGRDRIEVSLTRGFPWPALPMDLELVPWFNTFGTKIGLRPRRVLHPTRFYFASGHALLDLVIARLRSETAAGATPP
jgi:hypothetical protein